MTRKEAEKQAKELNATDPKWFCPLINNMCRKDCVNFTLAYVDTKKQEGNAFIHDAKDDSFEVFGYSCSNAMFLDDFFCPSMLDEEV